MSSTLLMFHVWNVSSTQRNCFNWPAKDDVLRYDDDDIICKIDAPIPVNQRNNFVLSVTDFENVNAMTTKILKKMMFLMDNKFFDVVSLIYLEKKLHRFMFTSEY